MPWPVMAEVGITADVAAPVFWDQFLLGQLTQHLVGVGAFFVDLVHRHHQRDTSSFGVVDRFDGLRHDAVVGSNHDHRHVGGLAPRARISVNAS